MDDALIQGVLDPLTRLPSALVYVVIGVGAAIENVFPPVPADTFVLVGAFLAVTGRTDPLIVFLVTWVPNVITAIAVYALAYRYGRAAFGTTAGRWLLKPRQLEQIADFYGRWGTPAIFVSRFLPAFRAVVPVFAGISHLPPRYVIAPIAMASVLWYGVLVYIGTTAGRNWRTIVGLVARVNDVLLVLALALAALLALWWWRTRRHDG
ncbi:MAG: DedA family protein [Gemmatimonadota bacterium]